MLGSDPHEDQEAPPPRRTATAGAPFASESQPTAEENKPAGTPREPQQTKAGPPTQGPGGQTPDPRTMQSIVILTKTLKNYPTRCHSGRPQTKAYLWHLPLKSLTVSGVIVVHTVFNVVASFLTVRFFASTCTCKLRCWTRMHPSAKLVPCMAR